MKVRLKFWKHQGVFIAKTLDGNYRWSKTGDEVEMPDASAYKVVRDFPDLLEAVVEPTVIKKVVTEYKNKSIERQGAEGKVVL